MSQKVVREVVREVRDRPPTIVHRRDEEPPVVVPRRAPAPVVVAKPPLSAARQFDPSDLAPEDRVAHNGVARAPCNRWPQSTGRVGPFDPIVTGSFHILGVNYSRYENAKSAPRVLEKFHKAICEDVVSEVGCGITPNDVLLNIMPGAIDNVILHYHTESDGTHVPVKSPKLVDAVWRMKVDYCLVTRDVQRQQQAAMAMYTALNSGYNMAHKTATAYVKYLAEGSDVTSVRIVPGPGQGQQAAPAAAAAAPAAALAGRAPAPQRPNLPSPPRSTALDAHVRRHVPAPPQDARQQQMQMPVQQDQGQQRHGGGGGGGLVPPPLPKRGRSRLGEESPIRASVHLLSPRVEEKIWAPYGDPPPYGCGAGASEAGYAAVAKQAAEAAVCHAAQAAAYSRGSPHGSAYATPQQQQQQQQGQAVAVAAAAAASASAAASATVCSGAGSGTPTGYSAEVLKDMQKDKELELLESEIRKERQAIQSSLQSASAHRTYRQV